MTSAKHRARDPFDNPHDQKEDRFKYESTDGLPDSSDDERSLTGRHTSQLISKHYSYDYDFYFES